ncbi:MAG: hypothetical protein ABN482_06495 [Corticimicrobacter sp.]|uniref:hypothetical protein n=1 Tax=Corticimicrobacter sp. TaxID=2678536 RepID=UPI0032DA0FD0
MLAVQESLRYIKGSDIAENRVPVIFRIIPHENHSRLSEKHADMRHIVIGMDLQFRQIKRWCGFQRFGRDFFRYLFLSIGYIPKCYRAIIWVYILGILFFYHLNS